MSERSSPESQLAKKVLAEHTGKAVENFGDWCAAVREVQHNPLPGHAFQIHAKHGDDEYEITCQCSWESGVMSGIPLVTQALLAKHYADLHGIS